MALRSPTEFHSFWGSYATVNLPTGTNVQVGDTAYDTTTGKLVVCTSIGPVVWSGVGAGFDLSFQGENTGTAPEVIGAVYFATAPILTAASCHALLGVVVGADTATLRLVEQATSTVVATWTRTGALTDVTASSISIPAAGWYVFDLAGSAGGTVTRCYGAHLE